MTFAYLLAALGAFYLFLIAEFMIPSGGILGVAAAGMLITAIVIAFSHSLAAGAAVIAFTLVTTPLVLMGTIRAWPHTPMGRRMLNRRPGEEAPRGPVRTTSQGVPLDALLGRVGVAKTNLLPGGLVIIDGERLDAVSLGIPIDAGTPVVVTRVELNRLQVRPATEQDVGPPASPALLEHPLD
jgi:membrane-bound ClpP family serine protease